MPRKRGKSTAADIAGIRRFLLAAARRRSSVTYGEMMKRFKLSRGRKLSQTIGMVDRAEYRRGAPGFAAIIVRKDTGFPGGGYFCDDELPAALRRGRVRANDPRLSIAEKAHVDLQKEKIWSYYSKLETR